jgi:2,3-bisphosphoglycerate-independent phosphoglycerate mutase
MVGLEQIKLISRESPSKIVLLVIDGLGGLPHPDSGKTELEIARTPNMDKLAREGACGLIKPVGTGITPGSAPGHLALFGYDPVEFAIGRGVLEALGIDLELRDDDIAARGNFCTIDKEGLITDRRAGRISTEMCGELCKLLSEIAVSGAQALVSPVREHRFVLILRGEGLSAALGDSDHQQVGVPPLPAAPLSSEAGKTADIANQFISQAKAVLAHSYPANMILLRGFSRRPSLPTMREIYRLKPAAIATYPMYRGLAKLVGMEILNTGSSIEDEFVCLAQHWGEFDFFFVHIKKTDSAGEDGNFEGKARVIEEIDAAIPYLMSLKPDVVVITGDHSTPAVLRAHSWHPVPLLLYSQWCRWDAAEEFSERACASGSLGVLPGVEVMPLAMANALKLTKFGA